MEDPYRVSVEPLAVNWKTETGRELEQILHCEFKQFRDHGITLLKKRLLLMGNDFGRSLPANDYLQPDNLTDIQYWTLTDINLNLSELCNLINIWTDLNSASKKFKEHQDYIERLQKAFHNNLFLDDKHSNKFYSNGLPILST